MELLKKFVPAVIDGNLVLLHRDSSKYIDLWSVEGIKGRVDDELSEALEKTYTPEQKGEVGIPERAEVDIDDTDAPEDGM